jgi:hypothetical protein
VKAIFAPQVSAQKKADVAEHPKVVHHVGLLVNGPSGSRRAALQLVIRQFKPHLRQRDLKRSR